MKKAYTVKYRRKREGKTDYKARLKLLTSRKNRIVVRRMLNNILIQFSELGNTGDKTLISCSSRELLKYGWQGHKGNIPSAYLTGYLCGLKANKKGLKEGVLDFGLSGVVRGSAFFGAVKGLIDAGIQVPCSEEALPKEEAVCGKVIADYALELSKDKELYSKQFNAYLKKGFKPEDLPKNFEETKKKIKEKWQ